MSRRFSDEPINLIHRIPTPEQLLAAARPSKRSWGQAVVDTGAGWVQGLAKLIRQATGSETAEAPGSAHAAPDYDAGDIVPERRITRPALRQPAETMPAEEGSGTAVQPEEVAELRAYILSQQHDIARLSAQIQELKSLLVSQQQVLAYLGKELEAAPTSGMTGVASAPAKRNRGVRDKPALPRKDVQNPSLSL